MTQDRLFAPSDDTIADALIDDRGYLDMYAASVADPDAFWAEPVSYTHLTLPTK